MPRDWELRILDILEAIEKIERYTAGIAYESFAADEMRLDAVLRNITVIGEAARHVPPEVRERHPHLPWEELRGIRNVVTHEYFRVSWPILWHTATQDLPPLIPALKAIVLKEQTGKMEGQLNMDYRSETVRKYLDDAASNLPAPGGGSVSAAAGALGAAMGSMVCNLTVGKEQFDQVQAQVKEILAKCEAARQKLLDLAQADVEAYGHVAKAYKMPRQTPEEKEARRAAIQQACKTALEPPLQTVRAGLDVLRLMEQLVGVGNPNLISDVGVAVLLAEAALRGAKLNVDINLNAIKDAPFVAEIRKEMESSTREAARLATLVMAKVDAALKK